MTAAPLPRILQVGVGGFGQQHLRAWQDLGARDHLWIADVDRARLAAAQRLLGLPADRVSSDPAAALPHVDVVDVVTGTDSHYAVCAAALEAGKDVFVEKPMTATGDEARRLHDLAGERARLLQVGYYYRCHPASAAARALIERGDLGRIRYLSGAFMGFKRARGDAGVTQTDAVHFIDLFNWLLGQAPMRVFAVTRDHFGRGLEDLSIVVLQYAGGVTAKVESGYIQPGRWRDRVVPGAFTTKEIFVCGSRATIEIDFEQERLDVHHVRHELRDGNWAAVAEGHDIPPTATMTPVQMIAAELQDFLACVATRRPPTADSRTAGVLIADIVAAIHASATTGAPVDLVQ